MGHSSVNNRVGVFKESQNMLGQEADIILETFQDAQEKMPGKFYIVVK